MAGLSFYALLLLALLGLGSGRHNAHSPPAHGPSPSHAHWSYRGVMGPASWSRYFSDCGMDSQSPINIDTYAVSDSHNKMFVFKDFRTRRGSLKNNGHTVQFTLDSGYGQPTVTGGNLPNYGIYKVAQFHFHWGSSDSTGSEHTINGRHSPLEMHIVAFNSKHNSIGDSLYDPHGLAVLSVMFELHNGSAHASSKEKVSTSGLDEVIKYVEWVIQEGSEVVLDLNLNDLLPKNRMEYYRYQGSLTTPPCSQVVTWSIFAEKPKVSSKQMNKFRKLTNLNGNFRPVQGVNSRTVSLNH